MSAHSIAGVPASAIGGRRARKAARGAARRLRGLAPLAGGLALWQLVGSADSPYAPPPSTWIDAVRTLQESKVLGPALVATVETVVIAIVVAVVVGALIGTAVGASARVARGLGPTLEFLRTVPPPAIVPAAALVLGLGRTMAVSVVVLAAVWPVTLNTVAAVRGLHPVLRQVTQVLGLSVWQRVVKVYLPALLPGVALGVRVAAPVCVIVTLLVEMLTGTTGIGSLLLQAQRNFLSAQAFGLLVIVGLFGLGVNAVVAACERAILSRWPPRHQDVR
jgi:ABC-type nitrate/sulfonate/bicarbonate transport system permease component